MRINVYSQELTKEVTVIEKTSADTGATHYGVRLYLASPDILHHTADDDDRSAITFWIPNCGSFTPFDLAKVLEQAALEVRNLAMSGKVKPNARDSVL